MIQLKIMEASKRVFTYEKQLFDGTPELLGK
jgi:hypothetical protein